MNLKAIFIIGFFCYTIGISSLSSASDAVTFPEKYQDYQGNWYIYNNENLMLHPYYIQTENSSIRNYTSLGDTISIPKTMNVSMSLTKINPSMTFPKSLLASKYINVNATTAYLVFPYSLSRTRDYIDEHNIKIGRWHFDTAMTIFDDNSTTSDLNSSAYDLKIVSDEIRLYFLKVEANKLQGNITFQMNSWTIDNATTQGWSTSNITLNNTMITGCGQVRLAYNSSLYAGLVAAYSMDENCGNIIHNTNNINGTINRTNQGTWNGNTTLNYTSGVIGNAGLFDGVNDYVDAGNDASLNITGNQITLSARFKTSSGTGYPPMIVKGTVTGNPTDSYFLRLALGKISGGVYTSSLKQKSGGSLLNDSTWHFGLMTYNGSQITIYADGFEVGNNSQSGNINGITSVVRISGMGDGSYVWNGSIDEVMIWNRALNASEVAMLYNNSLAHLGNITILNQTATTGNIINRTRLTYSLQNNLTNISIYGKQNGSASIDLEQANATSGMWYPNINQYNAMDFILQFWGNGSNSSLLTSLEWDEDLNPIQPLGTIVGTCADYQVNDSVYLISGNELIAPCIFKTILQKSITTEIIQDNGTVYLGAENILYAINSSNGKIIFIDVLQKNITTKIKAGNSSIYLAAENIFYKINKSVGTIITKIIYSSNINIIDLP